MRTRRELTKLDFPNAARVKKEFGTRIKAGRIKAELSQNELAAMTGVCRSQVDHIEAGRNFPSMSVFIVLCRALKMEIPVWDL